MNDVISLRDTLLSYAPEYYQDSKLYKSLMYASAKQLVGYENEKNDVLEQLHPETATWGLELWEKDLQLFPSFADSIETRRARVISELYKNEEMVRLEMLNRIVNVFVPAKNAKVQLVDGGGAFEVTLPIGPLPFLFHEMKATIDEIKPAHVEALYEGEIDVGAMRLTDGTYAFSAQYKECGEFSGESKLLDYKDENLNAVSRIYSFPVEFETSEANLEMFEDESLIEDKTYRFQAFYQYCGELETMNASLSLTESSSITKCMAVEISVPYLECGEFEAEGE
ncbi:putative phage tail protein [Bacillus sp. CGMCC 1.16541]|uniref:putative phage tail protein n=1 Tax=Bacillus sp. CGMCC 1.16541 TaxID=2185143 RepID=UPI000D730AAB|nr:putative phage tail protein [Bacillus sp. CGMCC 1.16541]